MSEVSSRRRRFGIAAITTTALALPLTASITYAQAEAPEDGQVEEHVIETIDPDGEGERRVIRIERRTESEWTTESEDGERRVRLHVIHGDGDEAGEEGEHRRIVRRIHRDGDHEISEEELEAMMAELEAELEGMDGEIEAAIEIAMATARDAEGLAGHSLFITDDESGLHELDIDCDDADGDVTIERDLGDGRRAVVICRTQVRAYAAEGLREAREQLMNDPNLTDEMREEILRALDESLEELSARPRTVRRQRAKVDKDALAPNAPATTMAMRWSGRMVSPVAPVTPVRWEVRAPASSGWQVETVAPVAPVAPVQDADCDEEATTRA